jgi:hypothetical protein
MLRARIDIECLRQYLAVLQDEAIGFQFEQHSRCRESGAERSAKA